MTSLGTLNYCNEIKVKSYNCLFDHNSSLNTFSRNAHLFLGTLRILQFLCFCTLMAEISRFKIVHFPCQEFIDGSLDCHYRKFTCNFHRILVIPFETN